jgi:hypothetical protein
MSVIGLKLHKAWFLYDAYLINFVSRIIKLLICKLCRVMHKI